MVRFSSRWPAALAAIVTVLAGAAAHAAAPPASPANPCGPAAADPAPFAANTNRVGLVDLHFFSAQGATVTYYECVADRAYRLGERSMPGAAITSMFGASPWRCGRLTRHFAATATLPDGAFVRGTTSVRTMSCAHRFELDTRRQVARGLQARVRIVDRWGIGGIRTRLCLTSPRGRRGCQRVPFAAAASVASRRFRASIPGLWRVQLQVAKYVVRDTIAVGVSSVPLTKPPTVLATGDSTMQGVESFLSDDLRNDATVVSDVRPGFAISRHDGWAAVAASQVARLKPTTTVMSLGAAEGFPMTTADSTTHECCDAGWVDEYARRVRNTMRIYRRHGHGRVVYLTVVAPRDAERVPIVNAVNLAIVHAAEGLSGVRVLRMDLLFSPHGYQEILRYRGREVHVREPDGVHLNASGTAIEAREAAQAVRGR